MCHARADLERPDRESKYIINYNIIKVSPESHNLRIRKRLTTTAYTFIPPPYHHPSPPDRDSQLACLL
jgi:hypothetical protein